MKHLKLIAGSLPGKFSVVTEQLGSVIGFQTCKAVGIESATDLSRTDAELAARKVEAWIESQTVRRKK